MTWTKRLVSTLAAVALSLSLAQSGASQPATYEIHVILSLTGGGTFLGSSAQASLKTLQRVVNQQGGIRGQPIQFVFYDDQTNPLIAVQLTNAIIEKKVPVIIGSSLSAACRAMAPLAPSGPLIYCLSPGVAPEKDSYLYAILMPAQTIVAATMHYFQSRGWQRVALITTTDASGVAAVEDFQAVFQRPEFSNLTLVANERLNPGDLSAAAQIARIKASAPDAICVWVPGTPFATVLRSLKDAGVDVPTASTQANMSYTQMRQYEAFLPSALYFHTAPFMGHVAANAQAKKAEDVFFDAMRQSGVAPDALVSGPWDPAMILVDAFRHLGTSATAKQLRDYIDGVHGFGGISGVYDFRTSSHRGLSEKDVIIMRWDRAKSDWSLVSGFGGVAPKGSR